MLFFLVGQHLMLKAAQRKRIERRLQFASCGFGPHVQQLTLYLRHVNNYSGSTRKRCTVFAKFRGGGHISASKTSPSVMAAIGGALKRLRYRLAFRVQAKPPKQHPDASAHVAEYWIG